MSEINDLWGASAQFQTSRCIALECVMTGPTSFRAAAFVFGAVLATLGACSGIPEGQEYLEPELPAGEAATLVVIKSESETGFFVGNARVEMIGEKWVDTQAGVFGTTERKVTPGDHEIQASTVYSRSFGSRNAGVRAQFRIHVEAGRHYQIRAGLEDDLVRIWVEDSETKAIAGMATVLAKNDD